MIEAEPSKIAEFTSATFPWNPSHYRPHAVSDARLRMLGGRGYGALRVFAQNNYSPKLNATDPLPSRG